MIEKPKEDPITVKPKDNPSNEDPQGSFRTLNDFCERVMGIHF